MAYPKFNWKQRKRIQRNIDTETIQKVLRPTQHGNAATKSKEAAVLRDSSLCTLARAVGTEKALCLLMYLNIPTLKIIKNIDLTCKSENGYSNAGDSEKNEVLQNGLIGWKAIKSGCKEKEKVKDLDRALREMGKPELAEVLMEKHGSATELTPDAFSSL